MTALYIITGVSLGIGILNLFAVLFLSNSLFRILLKEDRYMLPPAPSVDSGLVDPTRTATYDPRFQPQSTPGK